MLRKRVVKLDEVQRDNPHAKVELRKRLLQLAALSVALLAMISPYDSQPDPVTMAVVTRGSTLFKEPSAMLLMLGKRGSISFSQVRLPDEDSSMTLGEWLENISRSNQNEIGGPDSFALSAEEIENMNRCWKLIINLCLYVAERGKGERQVQYTTKKAKRRASKTETTFERKPIVWLLGKEIKLSKELVQAARSQYLDESAWTIKKRFVVRGHWRDQAYGPGRTLRKRMWIEAFWKGPTEGERLAHLYTDKKEGED